MRPKTVAFFVLFVVAFSSLGLSAEDWDARIEALAKQRSHKELAEIGRNQEVPIPLRFEAFSQAGRFAGYEQDQELSYRYFREAGQFLEGIPRGEERDRALQLVATGYLKASHPEAVVKMKDDLEGAAERVFEPSRMLDPLAGAYVEMGRWDEASRTHLKVAESAPSEQNKVKAWRHAIGCIVKSGRPEQALRLFQKAKKHVPAPMVAGALAEVADGFFKQGDYRRAVECCRDAMRLAWAASTGGRTLGEAQARIVDYLLLRGKLNDALAEAKRHYALCPIEEMGTSVELVGKVLKAADGNVHGRVKDFFDFQAHGPAGRDGKVGTADDLTDPLAGVTYPRLENIALPSGVGLMDRMKFGRYFLLLGEPKRALAEFRCAYAAEDGSKLEGAIYGVATVLKALDGHPLRANRYLLYQRHGPAGEDGKPGTRDDIENPLAGVPIELPGGVIKRFDAEIVRCGPDFAGIRRRAKLLLASGRAQEGLAAMRKAYGLSSLDQQELDLAVQGMATAIKAVDGHIHRANRYILFQKHGRAGEDGKEGTKDDLTDPLEEIKSAEQE